MINTTPTGVAEPAASEALMSLRKRILLKLMAEAFDKNFNIFVEDFERLIQRHLYTVNEIDDPDYYFNLNRDLTAANVSFQAVLVFGQEILAAAKAVAANVPVLPTT